MKTITVLFAGAMLTSAVLGAMNDPGAEERYRMKYGRYTPAEEARQEKASPQMNCTGHCSQMHHEMGAYLGSPVVSNDAENRFRAKFGRPPGTDSGALAIRLAADRPSRNVIARSDSGNEERFRMKFGRSTPDQEQPQAEPMLIASSAISCEEMCHRQQR